MKYTLAAVAIAVAGVGVGAGGSALHTQAATGPAVYTVYETNVTDEAAYKAALPEVEKMLKEHNAQRVAGGFNKTKTIAGTPAGNRYVIIKFDDMAAFEKFWDGGAKAWVEKHAPTARQIIAEAVQ